MPNRTLSPSSPPIDWPSLDDAGLLSWIAWLSADLDRWNDDERGYLPKHVDEDLLASAYAERERRQEVRLERAS